ncbi:MAG: XdhC family protein [Candidatus Eremiobacteraeota bacterium]|nr:XdhC family protein [Candidatus Eremiobacteraeota bacterium]MCW5865949.1 XdhC family protein [Candidatus Eremiobacteraeota bacterium]
MKELKALLARAGEADFVATVVETSGSVYRRPGARMLISQGRPLHGLVSGGCLESDLAERALSGPQLITYDNASGAEELWGAGVGCNGIISLWLEPLTPRLLNFWKTCLAARRAGRTALMYRCSTGAFQLGQRWYDEEIPVAWQRGHYRTADWSVWVEQLQPPPRLVVCGAGPDAVPLVRGALTLGWDVRLVDHRPAFLENDQFAGAERARHDLRVRGGESVVIMSHNLERDRAYLDLALASPAGYIGMLGPRERTRRLLAGRADGRVHGPVGLDIGSQTPEEIALAILAEIMAVHSGRNAGSLSQRDCPERLGS